MSTPDPRLTELLEAYREASSDVERTERIEALRAHCTPARTTQHKPEDPDRATVERAVSALDTDLAAAERIVRDHFAPAPMIREISSSDASEPPPVIWHDGDQHWADAVLSVGEVAILASPGGLGKSTLVLELAIAAVAKGKTTDDFGASCGLRVRPGPVVLVSYEDSTGRIAARITRMAGKKFPSGIHVWPDPVPLFVGDDSGGAVPAPNWHALWDEITAIKPSFVVVDPASAALSNVSTNESGPVRAFLRELTHQATAAECGVLVIAHDTKAARNAARAGEDPGAGAVAGSATWHDAARGVLYMRRDNKTRTLDCIKANYGRSGWSVALAERTDPAGRFIGFEVDTPSLRNPIP